MEAHGNETSTQGALEDGTPWAASAYAARCTGCGWLNGGCGCLLTRAEREAKLLEQATGHGGRRRLGSGGWRPNLAWKVRGMRGALARAPRGRILQ